MKKQQLHIKMNFYKQVQVQRIWLGFSTTLAQIVKKHKTT